MRSMLKGERKQETMLEEGSQFCNVAAAVAAVGAVASASMQADAAGEAADAQAAGAANADATQRYFYDTSRKDQLPWLNRGNQAGDRLQYLMGLSPYSGGSTSKPLTREELRARLLPQYTNNNISSSAGSPSSTVGLFGGQMDYGRPNLVYAPDGSIMAMGNGQTSQSTVDETGLNAEIDRQLAEQQRQQQQAQDAANNDPEFGSLMRNFSMQDMQNDPVYQSGLQFGLDEGMKGIDRQNAASGSLLSGAALKAAIQYGNDYASTKGNESFNRWNVQGTNKYNRLASIANIGQTAANQTSAAALQTGNALAQNQIGVGNARGASAIAQGNAWGNGLTGAYNAFQQNQLMKKIGNRSVTGSDFTGYNGSFNPDADGAFYAY